MSEVTFEIIEDPTPKVKPRGGIKNFTFNASGTNGSSHRANASKKKAQYLKNRAARSDLYASRSTCHEKEWHSRLNALSNGTA